LGCEKSIEILEKPVCPICERQAVGGKTHPGCSRKYSLDGLIVASKYRGSMRKAIGNIKYKWQYDIAKILVGILCENIWKFDFPKDAILVPIPLHENRKKWRGFNQSEIFSKILAKKFNVGFADLLVRSIETKSQVGLSKKERSSNVLSAFSIQQDQVKQIKGKNIILVDDVYTSGATMKEACMVLKRAGAASVWGMAITIG